MLRSRPADSGGLTLSCASSPRSLDCPVCQDYTSPPANPGGSTQVGKRTHLPRQGMWVPCGGREDPLEKEEASHTSVLAWDIPWTEELGGLQSMGLQRVGHDLATKQPPPANFALANSLWTLQPGHIPHPIPGKTGNPQISWGRLGLRASSLHLPRSLGATCIYTTGGSC